MSSRLAVAVLLISAYAVVVALAGLALAGLAFARTSAQGQPPPDWPGVDSAARAQTNYALNCQGCHLSDGRGAPDRVPRMNGFVGRLLSAPGGREYLVRVPGMTNAAVSDEELAELANWMLFRFDPQHIPADFKPYTVQEITENRGLAYTSEAAMVRERLLKSLDTAKERQQGIPEPPITAGRKP